MEVEEGVSELMLVSEGESNDGSSIALADRLTERSKGCLHENMYGIVDNL